MLWYKVLKLGTSKITNSHDFEPCWSALRIGLVGIATYLDDVAAAIGGRVVDCDGGLAPCAVQSPHAGLVGGLEGGRRLPLGVPRAQESDRIKVRNRGRGFAETEPYSSETLGVWLRSQRG